MDLMTLGHKNGGVFSRHDALDAGESDDSLARLRRDEVLFRLRRGMYVLSETYQAADDTGKHLLHARAALAAQRGKVALTGVSAAAAHGFAIHQQDLSVVHLVRLDDVSGRRTSTMNQHRLGVPLTEDELCRIDGLRSVSPARAVWEVACRSSLEAGVVTADSALHQDRQIEPLLKDLNERFASVPGSRRARIALRLADHRSESAGESVTRVQCYRFGLPAPELQHEVWDERGELVARLDFWWEDFGHAAEFDGRIKYDKLLRPGETAVDVVLREKRREDEVRALLRCGMTRIVWSMVMPERARRSMSELQQAMERSRRLYVLGLAVGA
ncbi:type IV toxin-antitoxin system AbiEi family antitoxin domain-containing protein [Microlunatus flavus]|uniref:Transcriptional regulator, AbiEi antitoxin, Type IV TA system n=1 Tax=Microlunatus flavus TaxID=1036181 RepID=A0A1H9FA70_9ACTN|nr:type IV toxin-antitoxin system AbiEi family antitoxin domain-containing protein [Microlunatus flavus]SEQ34745.1 Transcriptional regulator, AbiEi antitoxin, Type IV TA system [Microlunatus flavus]